MVFKKETSHYRGSTLKKLKYQKDENAHRDIMRTMERERDQNIVGLMAHFEFV